MEVPVVIDGKYEWIVMISAQFHFKQSLRACVAMVTTMPTGVGDKSPSQPSRFNLNGRSDDILFYDQKWQSNYNIIW